MSGMYDSGNQTQVEGFVMKWTIISSFTVVVVIFGMKVLLLFTDYITCGKLVADFGTYIWDGIKLVIFGG